VPRYRLAVHEQEIGQGWFVRPRPWSIVLCSMLVIGTVGLWLEGLRLAACASGLAGLAWLSFGGLPHADRHNATRIAGLTAAVSLAVTWTSAVLAALLYASFAAKDPSAKIWIPITLIAATNFGGLLAVFRSAQTRTETSAALREMSDLRIAVLSAPVIEAADRASRAKTFEELTASFSSMLQLAVNLSLLPRAVDQASLWALDEQHGEWFICAATTAPQEQQFRQKVVTAATPKAGIVANLAASAPLPPHPGAVYSGDVYLVGQRVHEHPWYLVNPDDDHPAEGMAVVLLRREHKPFGALCFTWESQAVPTTGARAQEMIDILQRWAQAFGVGLTRLYRLREELKKS
jgi:hypothetical protein